MYHTSVMIYRKCEYVNIVRMNASVFLADLSDKLGAIKRRNLATQAQIYEFTGVDQATISRVLNGERRRVNESLLRLDEYVNMLLQDGELSKDIQQAAQKFLSRGGNGSGIDCFH